MSGQSISEVRSEVTRMTRLLRQFLLQVGEVTGVGDGVFFLSLDEMVNALGSDRSSFARISARRETYFKYASVPPYPSIIIGNFDPFKWAADPYRRSDYFDSRESVTTVRETVIRGFAGATGCVEGTVRRIDCVEDGNQIQPGEILVTVTTNVGWTPLFPSLSAIVSGINNQVGTLEAGKIADVLSVSSNPLDDLQNLLSIQMVIHHGQIIRDENQQP